MIGNDYFLKSEDDTDFIPIIPLNESENESDKITDVPDDLPVLPLRNTVLFPGVVLPITVGRDKSIKAVNDAYKTNKLVCVLAQTDSSVEEPEVKDLCRIGTVAKIVKLIKMPDGGTTIIIQGKKRFEIQDITTDDPYFKANVRLLDEDVIPADEDFAAYVSNIKDLAGQIVSMSPNIPTEASIILKNIENPSFLINFVSSNLNSEIGEKQRLLEINDVKARAAELMQILQKELQFAELKNKVTNKTRTELDKQQREYFLQQQLKSIKDELGGDLNDRELTELKRKGDGKSGRKLLRTFLKTTLKSWRECIPARPITRSSTTTLI